MKTIEKRIREALAASHHIVHLSKADDLVATHLSARIPDTDQLLITPHNLPFEEVCASNLVKIDIEGNIISDRHHYGVMPQAVNIHASVYQKRDNVMSAMHTHSIYGNAVASLKCGLLYINQHAIRFYNEVAYHDFDGLALDNEGDAIADALGDKKVMILRNHGLLTTGASVGEACYLLHYLERCCQMQITAMSAGSELLEIPPDVCAATKAQYDRVKTPDIDFQALVRRVKGRLKVDYRS